MNYKELREAVNTLINEQSSLLSQLTEAQQQLERTEYERKVAKESVTLQMGLRAIAQHELTALKKRLSEGVGYVIVRDCNGDLFIHQHSSSNEGIKINRYWFKNLDNDAEMPIAIVPLTDSELKEGE